MDYDIYGDISKRTNGDIYIGVVGPVRTGKSTFITKFMENLVLPNMTDGVNETVDQLPQSGSGQTIMTTEPKFVPAKAQQITIGNLNAKIRLIDCVGYMVDGALGDKEEDKERLVSTPWSSEPMPFSKASELGTTKVICDHSTIGIVVTTDGSFTKIDRSSYEEREKEVVARLKAIGKPFVVVYNTTTPTDEKVVAKCQELSLNYGVSVVPSDILNIDKEGLELILGKVLEEFPLKTINVDLPGWIVDLDMSSQILSSTISSLQKMAASVSKMKDFTKLDNAFDGSKYFMPIQSSSMDMATGTINITLEAKNGVFFEALKEVTKSDIDDETALMSYVLSLKEGFNKYLKLEQALLEAEEAGYGITPASLDDSRVGKPEVVKSNGQYAVKMKVDFNSLHIIRADLNAEIEPVYGSQSQCENFVALMEDQGYNAQVFGRTVKDIMFEELQKKCQQMPETIKSKVKRVVTRSVNDNKNSLIYILI